MIIVSTGCPAGIGPEVSVAAAARLRNVPCVLVGDERTLHAAAELTGVASRRLVAFDGSPPPRGKIALLQVGPPLDRGARKPGRPSRASGAAQLGYVNAAYDLARAGSGRALATGPVSKAVIAKSGHPGSEVFLGHTEWLRDRDGASAVIMCFVGKRLSTSLVTTHLPISNVAAAITPEGVSLATVWLGRLLRAVLGRPPKVAVAALNPHAGEARLLGEEESQAILPGIRAAQRALGRRARVAGPIGAETAYRKAYAGHYDGVVAMYHDQATIPMKLVQFGTAVNVTMGLSVVRTSVDHGTAYDVAWQGKASPDGMISAIQLAAKLAPVKALRR